MTFPAKSSRSKISTVAMSAINPATLACTNGSRSDLAKAGTSTFFLVFVPKLGARRPIKMQVFVRMDGSVSVCILARRRRRSLFRIRSVSCASASVSRVSTAPQDRMREIQTYLGRQREHCFHCSFPDDRDGIRKASDLYISLPARVFIGASRQQIDGRSIRRCHATTQR